MERKLKEWVSSLKKGEFNKENLIAFIMGLVIVAGLATFSYFWYYFSLKLDKEIQAIDRERDVKYIKKISPDDFSRIDGFFLEKEKKYRDGSQSRLPEIF